MVAMEMCVVVFVGVLGTMAGTQGVLQLVATINGFVNDALFFKSLEGAVKRNAIELAEMRFDIGLRQGFTGVQENTQYLHPDSCFAQLVLRKNIQSS